MSQSALAIHWIGLDVSSTDCYAAKPGPVVKRFKLAASGAAALVAWCRADQPAGTALCFVMEHTGVYSQAWAALLDNQGVSCALSNPYRIRQFALGSGQRSKTDKADARSILAYAQQTQPPQWTAPREVEAQLAHWQTFRLGLLKQRQQFVSRKHARDFVPQALPEMQSIAAELAAAVERAIAHADAQIAALIAADAECQAANRWLQSIPGIGEVTAAVLCRWLTALLTFSPAQLCAFSGLAPAHRQSGHSVRGKSRIDKAGPAALRCALYMAAVSASHHCPGLMELYQRLIAEGRPKKLALCAVARQLLLLAQAVVKSGEPWRKKKAHAA